MRKGRIMRVGSGIGWHLQADPMGRPFNGQDSPYACKLRPLTHIGVAAIGRPCPGLVVVLNDQTLS